MGNWRFTSCLRVSIAVIKHHHQKQLDWGECLFHSTVLHFGPLLGKMGAETPSRSLETGTRAEATRRVLLPGLLLMVYSTFSLRVPRTTSPGWHCYRELAPPTSTITQESGWVLSQMRFLFTDDSSLYRVDIKLARHIICFSSIQIACDTIRGKPQFSRLCLHKSLTRL